MAKIESFEDLVVWQKAVELFELTVQDVELFPKKRAAWVIEDQLLRSVDSMSANIAEGFGRRNQREYAHFLGVAKGSAEESKDRYIKILRIGYLSQEVVEQRLSLLSEITRMLNSLISKIHAKGRLVRLRPINS